MYFVIGDMKIKSHKEDIIIPWKMFHWFDNSDEFMK